MPRSYRLHAKILLPLCQNLASIMPESWQDTPCQDHVNIMPRSCIRSFILLALAMSCEVLQDLAWSCIVFPVGHAQQVHWPRSPTTANLVDQTTQHCSSFSILLLKQFLVLAIEFFLHFWELILSGVLHPLGSLLVVLDHFLFPTHCPIFLMLCEKHSKV